MTLFNQGHLYGELNPDTVGTALGGMLPGALRQYAALDEGGLVRAPRSLGYAEASTLTCAALTSWNALCGSEPLRPGEWVVVQGTGGVSLFAPQYGTRFACRRARVLLRLVPLWRRKVVDDL